MSSSDQDSVRLSDVKGLLFSLVWGSIIFCVVALKPFLLLLLFRALRRLRLLARRRARGRLAALWLRSRLNRYLLPPASTDRSVFAWLKPYEDADEGQFSGSAADTDAVFEQPDVLERLLERETGKTNRASSPLQLSRGVLEAASQKPDFPVDSSLAQLDAGRVATASLHVPDLESVESTAIPDGPAVRHVGASGVVAERVADANDAQNWVNRARALHLSMKVMTPWWSRMIPPVSDRLPIVTEDSLRYSLLVERLEMTMERSRVTLALSWIRLLIDLATCVIFYVEGELRRDYIGRVYYWPVGVWFAVDYAFRVFLLPHRGPYYRNHVFTLSAIAESLSIPSALRSAAGNVSFVNFNFLRSITAVQAFFYIYNRDMLREDHMYIGRVGRYVVSLSIHLFAIVFSIAMLMFDIEYASGSNHFTPTSSIYFTIVTVTTVGYGDYVATNVVARIYVTIVIVIMVAYFAYAIANIVNIYKMSQEGKGSFRAGGYRRHIVVTGRPSLPQLEAALSVFYAEQRNALAYFIIFLDDLYLSEPQTHVLQHAEATDRVRLLVGNVYEAYDRHRVDLDHAEMCLLFSGVEPRDSYTETHRIADDAALVLRARTVRMHYPRLPLHILFQTPYAVRQLEDLFIQTQCLIDADEHPRDTEDAVQAGLLEYETRTLCQLEFAAYLLAANVHCNGASTLVRNMLADPRIDRPLCFGDSLSILEYKTGVRHKLRRISLPERLAGVRLGELALELYLRFEVAVAGLLILDSAGAWRVLYNPRHKIGTRGLLFILCARHQFRPVISWLYSTRAVDDLWELRKSLDRDDAETSSNNTRLSKQSRSSGWTRFGLVEVALPEVELDTGRGRLNTAASAEKLRLQQRRARSRRNTAVSNDSQKRQEAVSASAFPSVLSTERAHDTRAATAGVVKRTSLDATAESRPLADFARRTASESSEPGSEQDAGDQLRNSDDDVDEDEAPKEATVILATCSSTLSTVFLELFTKALRSSVSYVRVNADSSAPSQEPGFSAPNGWKVANFEVLVLVPSLSNESHFAEIAAKYGPLRHVAGSVLRIADLARVQAAHAHAIVLVSNDTAQGFVEPETTFSGLEVFSMVNLDLLLRHYQCDVYVTSELSRHQALEMVPTAAPRRVYLRLGNPFERRPIRHLQVYHPIDVLPTMPPNDDLHTPREHGAYRNHATPSSVPSTVALRVFEAHIGGDEGFRYRNRFASGELTATSIFATALLTREHALPGVVLLTKSLFGMPVSRFDHRGRRIRISRAHLHLANVPAEIHDIRYVELLEIVIRAGALPYGLYRGFHHNVRVSVADLHQMLLSRFSSNDHKDEGSMKPYESILDLVSDLARRLDIDSEEFMERILEPLTELDTGVDGATPGQRRQRTCFSWLTFWSCGQRRLPFPNRILNLGTPQNSLPYVLTNPPPYVRVSRHDGVYVVTENFERFLKKFHAICAQSLDDHKANA